MRQKPLENIHELLIIALGLNRISQCNELTQWLDVKQNTNEITAAESQQLDKLMVRLHENIEFWNEEELKMLFISGLIELANYNEKHYRIYFDKEIQAQIGDILLKSKADMMLAKGVGQILQTPYFCFHEYKKEVRHSGDPIGQLLSAMLIAQHTNQNQKPVYGAYIIGRNWFFVVLHHKNYCISNAYNATETDDLHAILLILRKLKTIIKETLLD
jgi:hypothetical protein